MKQKQVKQQRYSKKDFDSQFPNDDACLEWLKERQWPNGVYCDKCKRITKHYRVSNRSAYACEFCGTHVYPMKGTILEHSSTSLKTWFHAMFLMSNTRCGISAAELQRQTGVTYKTAWRMFKQIRDMLDNDVMSLLQEIEVDETYIGGRRHGKRGRGAEGKTPVFGMVERNGSIVAMVVPDVKAKTLVPIIKEKILSKSIIYSDEFPAYDSLEKNGYSHQRVHHASKVYVAGDAHTNTIEGFWSLVKRGLSGTNHSVSAKYLQGYINSYAFRWNRRNNQEPMFLQVLSRLIPSLQA